MQVNLQVNDRTTVTANGDNPLAVFEELAMLQEIFGETSCKKCVKDNNEIKGGKSDRSCNNLTYRVRNVADGKKTYVYPELVCQDCWAKFTFGQSDDGVLFPVRFLREGKEYVKDKDGKNVPKGEKGWVRFNKATNKEE